MSDELIVFVALEQYPHDPSHVVGTFSELNIAKRACEIDNRGKPLTWQLSTGDRRRILKEAVHATTNWSSYSIRELRVDDPSTLQ